MAAEDDGQQAPVVDSPSISADWPEDDGSPPGADSDWPSGAQEEAEDSGVPPRPASWFRKLLRPPALLSASGGRSIVGLPTACAAMGALAELRNPLDAFFDKVTVNAEDKALRANRLNLLTRIRSAMDRVADFSKIEG